MTAPTNQPQPTDAVLGGSGPPPVTSAVLGGLEGVKRRLEQGGIRDRIAALAEALNYGAAGQTLIDHQDRQATHPLRTALSFLQHHGAEHPAFQMLLQSQVCEFEVVTVDKRGEINQRELGQALSVITDLGSGTTLEMVAIPGGTFLMGSPESERSREDNEGPQHLVTMPPFYMGRYPVTQAQWRRVAAMPLVHRELDPDPSHFKGDDRPVEQVSLFAAVEFCDRLSRYTGRIYRLPREAQWEYACRAGTTTPFHFGETITPEVANYGGNYTYGEGPQGVYRHETTPVDSFPANAFGLHDMHGNVWEWCLDHSHDNHEDAPSDGSAWVNEGGSTYKRRLCGGSWYVKPKFCRSASRSYYDSPLREILFFGFRVVFSLAWT